MTALTTYIRRRFRYDYLRWAILLAFAITASIWAFHLPFDQAPEEATHFLLPQFIFQHGALPLGTDGAVKAAMGNQSFAYYPQWLGPLLQAFAMWGMKWLHNTPHALLFAARAISILSGLVTLGFLGRLIDRLFKSSVLSAMMMAFVAFLPQFLFLASYVNTDMLGLAGVSLICWGMAAIATEGWTWRSSAGFIGGAVVSALGDISTYGFLLAGVVFFVAATGFMLAKHAWTWPQALRAHAITLVWIGTPTLPFFIRNWMLYHDVLGFSANQAAYSRWLASGGAILRAPFDGTFMDLVLNLNFYKLLVFTGIGRFGNLTITMSTKYYLVYLAIAAVGVGAAFVWFITRVILHHANATAGLTYDENLTTLSAGLVRHLLRLFYLVFIVAGVATLVGFMVYSFHIDYDPQARYIITLLIPSVMLLAVGYQNMMRQIPAALQHGAVILLIMALIVYDGRVYANFFSLLF